MSKIAFLFSVLGVAATLSAKSMNILVYPPQNNGDKQFSWLAAGMTETIVADLSRIESVRVVTDDDRRKAMKEMDLGLTGALDEATTAKIGKMVGANVIFTGSYQVAGQSVRVVARIVNVETGSVETAVKIDGTMDKIFDLQDRIVLSLMSGTEKVKIKDITAVTMTDTERKRISDDVNPSPEAFELYARGVDASYGTPKDAVDYFKKALALEPQYVDAMIKLGTYLPDLKEAITVLENTYQILQGRGESESSRVAVLKQVLGYRYIDAGDTEKAKATLGSAAAWYEKRGEHTRGYYDTLFNLVKLYSKFGAYKTAWEYCGKMENIARLVFKDNSPEYASAMVMCANVTTRLKDYDAAGGYFDRANKYYSTHANLGKSWYLLEIAEFYRRQKKYSEGIAACMESMALLERYGRKDYRDYATILRFKGDIHKDMNESSSAAQCYRQAADIFGKIGDGKSKERCISMADALEK